MFGLVKKDLMVMKSNIRGMSVILIIYIVMAINGMFELSLILPLIGMVLLASTLSHDEQSNFNAYACTLPSGRKNLVKSKYLLSLLICFACAVFSLLIALLSELIKGNLDLTGTLSSLCGSIMAILIVLSFLYPFMFKFGVERGKIWMMVIIFGGIILAALLSELIEFSNLKQLVGFISEAYIYLGFFALSLSALFISYKISVKIMRKKEF